MYNIDIKLTFDYLSHLDLSEIIHEPYRHFPVRHFDDVYIHQILTFLTIMLPNELEQSHTVVEIITYYPCLVFSITRPCPQSGHHENVRHKWTTKLIFLLETGPFKPFVATNRDTTWNSHQQVWTTSLLCFHRLHQKDR